MAKKAARTKPQEKPTSEPTETGGERVARLQRVIEDLRAELVSTQGRLSNAERRARRAERESQAAYDLIGTERPAQTAPQPADNDKGAAEAEAAMSRARVELSALESAKQNVQAAIEQARAELERLVAEKKLAEGELRALRGTVAQEIQTHARERKEAQERLAKLGDDIEVASEKLAALIATTDDFEIVQHAKCGCQLRRLKGLNCEGPMIVTIQSDCFSRRE